MIGGGTWNPNAALIGLENLESPVRQLSSVLLADMKAE